MSSEAIEINKKLGLSSNRLFQWDDRLFLRVSFKMEKEEGRISYHQRTKDRETQDLRPRKDSWMCWLQRMNNFRKIKDM